MHVSSIVLFALSVGAGAIPLTSRQTTPFQFEQLSFTFEGGPASYTLNFPADGNAYYTNSNLSISLIDTSGFPAFSYCNFYTDEAKTLVLTGMSSAAAAAAAEIAVGPPQPVRSVACAPTGAGGMCLPDYTTCEWSGDQGTFLLGCCSGYCAATKCRPT